MVNKSRILVLICVSVFILASIPIPVSGYANIYVTYCKTESNLASCTEATADNQRTTDWDSDDDWRLRFRHKNDYYVIPTIHITHRTNVQHNRDGGEDYYNYNMWSTGGCDDGSTNPCEYDRYNKGTMDSNEYTYYEDEDNDVWYNYRAYSYCNHGSTLDETSSWQKFRVY